MTNRIKVLHLDSEKSWRGGENQIRLLMEGSTMALESYIAAPKDSEILKRLDGKFKSITGGFNFPSLIITIFKILKFIKKEGISIIDCQSSKAHNLGLFIKILNPNVKLIVHRRVDNVPSGSWFNRKKYINGKIDAYIAISSAIAQILEKNGINPEKIHVVKSATDDTRFASLQSEQCRTKLCQELGISKETPIIINVGYHTPQKGIPTLLQALSVLKKSKGKFVCLLAGGGELHEDFKILAKSLNLGDESVRFLGIRQDIPELLCGSDIFAFPSNFEGLGTSILDAIHGACAVAASDVGGIPEMIIHDKTGLLSPVGNSELLAKNLQNLLNNEKLRETLVKNAKEFISHEFSVSSMVTGNIKVYQLILGF